MIKNIKLPTLMREDRELMNVVKIICSCLRFLNSLRILPTLKVRTTCVVAGAALPVTYPTMTKIILAATIKMSKMFHFSLKYYLPNAISFKAASTVNIVVKT